MTSAQFDWITELLKTPPGGFGHHTVPIDEFVRRSGVDEDNWRVMADAWGERQMPRVEFGTTQVASGVLIRVRA